MKKKCGIFLVLVFLSLVPLLWFKNGLLIAGGDHSSYLNFGSYLNKLFSWNYYLNGGQPNCSMFIFFPFIVLYKLTQFLGMSAQLYQKIWFVFSYFLALISIRFLFNTLFYKRDSMGTLVAMVFYLFNLYTLVMNPFIFQYWLIYAAFPLTLALYIRGLDNPNASGKYVVLGGLSSLLYSATHPALLLVSFIPLISYLLYHLLLNRQKKRLKYGLIFSLKLFTFTILINLWVLYPSLYSLFPFMPHVIASQGKIGLWATISTQIYEAFRLLGQWAWSLHHLYRFYNNVLFIGLSYIAPFLVILVLFFNFKKTKVPFFVLLAIVGIFLSKGVNPPFGVLYKWAYFNIPGFIAFREPFTKFTFITAISYTIIIGFVVDKIWTYLFLREQIKFANFKKSIFVFVVAVLLLVNVWPVFTNYYIEPGGRNKKSFHVKIPDYWKEANTWLSSSKDCFSLLELPKDSGYGTYFNWEHGYNGINPSQFLLNVPLWGHSAFSKTYSDHLADLVYDSLYNKKTDKLPILLGMMNIKYIHLRTDIEWEKTKLTSPDFNRKALEFQKGLVFERKFYRKEFYR
ncbi:MAG: DUF3367 domain-containing protein, partial [Parcubacteria group bacterium]|nr:DUF3367 domain-containing protein [Parcubacteria group bacterium]